MRLLLVTLAIATLAPRLHAQGRRRTVETDSGRVVLHYFTTGQLSTRAWTDDKEGRWGRSLAYKRDGSVIVDHQTRRIAGHASVHFEYHANGAISKAEYSDAPDGGIQWYRSATTFDDGGNRTGFTEQGNDNDGYLPRPSVHDTGPLVVPSAPQQVVEEQRLFVNEVLVVNPTKWTCTVHVLTDEPSPALPGGTFTIGPRDTLRIGSYTAGERFEEPDNHVGVFVSRKKGKGPWYKMAHYQLAEQQVTPEHRRYYRIVDGWTSTKKIW